MAPKSGAKDRAESRGAAKSGAKARAGSQGAAKAKAKAGGASRAPAAPAEAAPATPAEAAAKEAAEVFQQYEPSGTPDGIIKLAHFAELIRATNRKKCMIWGDEPMEVIRREWTNVGGSLKKEIGLSDFQAWWPMFAERLEQELANREDAEDVKKAAAAQAAAEKYGHEGIWRIGLKDLPEAFKEARKVGKTPLVIDNTPNLSAETFFLYNGSHIIECKKMIVDKGKGKPVEEILEEERERFLNGAKCFQFGKTVVFRLANSACNILGQFSSESFPAAALMDAGEVARCVGVENDHNVEKSPFFAMAATRDERLDLSSVHEDFNVCVITQFAEEDYEEFLKPMLPLHLLQPIKPSVD